MSTPVVSSAACVLGYVRPGLADDVLRKIYYNNALAIIPGLDKSGFPK